MLGKLDDELMNNMRVLDLEIEDDHERIKRLKSADWLVFDFHIGRNEVIDEDYVFKITNDETGAKKKLVSFSQVDGCLNVVLLFKQFSLKINGENINALEETLLDDGDILEFRKRKYLINKQWSLEEKEARKILGKSVLDKSGAGLKGQLESLKSDLTQISHKLEESISFENSIQEQLERRESNKILLEQIIKQRKDLKLKFYKVREETIELIGQKLEKRLLIASNKVESDERERDRILNEITKTKDAISRRNEQEKKRKENLKQQQKSNLEKEALELQKKLKELERKKVLLSSDSNAEDEQENELAEITTGDHQEVDATVIKNDISFDLGSEEDELDEDNFEEDDDSEIAS